MSEPMASSRLACCPVCGTVFDVLEGVGGSGQAEAMLLGDGCRVHASVSPECTQDVRWIRGWELITVPQTIKRGLVVLRPEGERP